MSQDNGNELVRSRTPSLLPAFNPMTSSPAAALPNHAVKRKFDQRRDGRDAYYPTPVPTSSTGMDMSSPPCKVLRPCLERTVSTLSERAPLGSVPRLELNADGSPLHLGRSSNSSDYQLSANRLISRIHVRASYLGSSTDAPAGQVVIECLGWNGCKLHIGGQVVQLLKDETFRTDRPFAQIMVDVQDTRVLLIWPTTNASSCSPRRGIDSPATKRRAMSRSDMPSSPPPMISMLHSPVSSPVRHRGLLTTPSATPPARHVVSPAHFRDTMVKVYEDAASPARSTCAQPCVNIDSTSVKTVPDTSTTTTSATQAAVAEYSDHDEENNPAIHHFGATGHDILAKFEGMRSASPEPKGVPVEVSAAQCQSAPPRAAKLSPVRNHIINQLAFSRSHSIPLSNLYANLPRDLKTVTEGDISEESLSVTELETMLLDVPCVGEINREGKDAAGKQLENEFYYLPELDTMESRRDAVSVGRPPMRNVRKHHKVSPRSPLWVRSPC